MLERRILALLAFILALVGGILVLVSALSLGRVGDIDLTDLVRRAVEAILAIAAIFGGLVISKGRGVLSKVRMSAGGFMTVVIGVALVIVTAGANLGVILIIVGGVLGIIGARI